MTLSLRRRVALAAIPLLLLPAALGAAGSALLARLGARSDAILRENYDSVRATAQLNEARAALDTSPDAEQRSKFDAQLEIAERNVTIFPEEPALVAQLRRAADRYRAALDADDREALPPLSGEVRRAADALRALNESQMERAARAAHDTARGSRAWLLGAWGAATACAALAVWWLWRALIGPLRAVTDAAVAVGAGNLELVVPCSGSDELGRLAGAFNDMARKLRAYRQTNTERLLRARETARAAIDSFPDPVLVLDTLGRVESANPAARHLFGVVAPADGESGAAWVPPEPLDAVRAALAAGRALATDTFDQVVTFHAYGADRSYLPQLRPIRGPDGEPLGAAVVLNDVTRFRLLDRLKSDWVATVSHELKTPLTSVRLAVHVLLEEVVGSLEPKQVELLLEARDGAERLLALIEQLLALAKFEEGRDPLNLRPTDPAALLQSAADEAAARAADRHISLTATVAPDLPRIDVDPDRFARVLRNLIDNALAHTDPGGSVELRAFATDNAVSLEVRDTGVGIPAEYLPHVFERFFRVPGREDRPGTGLGLAIVREIVTAHGGTIFCESAEGQGTTFRITLPVKGARDER